MERDELKDKMTTAVKILRWELANMWGHVSVRAPGDEHFFLMHLRPPPDPAIPEDDLLEFDLEGRLVSGRREEPDEVFFYVCPYKAKTNVNAVIHCHPEMAVALTAARKKIVAVHHHSIRFGKGVPVAPWLYGLWPEHGEQATKVMGQGRAVIIRGHGAIVTGESLEEACITMVQLERAAKIIMRAASAGKVTPLPDGAIKKFRSMVHKRAQDPGVRSRTPLEWIYYESLLKKGERWSQL